MNFLRRGRGDSRDYDDSRYNNNTGVTGAIGSHHRRNDNTYNETGNTGIMGNHNRHNDHAYDNTGTLGGVGTHNRHNDRDYNNTGSTGIMGSHNRHNDGYDNTTGGIGSNHRHNDGYNNNTGGIMGSNRHNDYNEKSRHGRGAGGGGLFGRKRNRSGTGGKTRRPLFDMDSGNFNRRPSFGQWLKFTWLDILTMAAMGAVGLGVYNADPAPSRSFPITFTDGEIVYPQFAYPLRTEIVPIWEAALLASLIPIAVFLLMQIRIKSFWDINNAIIGLLYSLITAAVFQVFIKWLIGGLRPHFLYVCAPDLSKVVQGGQGFQNLMFQRDVCTGDKNSIDDSLESMPSGHSTAAFAGFVYLFFYLNAKLKVFSNYHPAMWKLIVTMAPLLGACLIAGSLTIDEYHNWYDCLAGAVIGTITAFAAYRMVYASIWDFRFNHIPLTRHTPFSYGAGEAGAGGFETAVFTRKAGWGYEEAYGGAPFDAAHHLRGAQAGFNNAVHNGTNSNSHGHGLGRDHNPHSGIGGHTGVGTTGHNTVGGYDGVDNRGVGTHGGVGTHHGVGTHSGIGTHSGVGTHDGIGNHHGVGTHSGVGTHNGVGTGIGSGTGTHHLGHRDGDIEHNASVMHPNRTDQVVTNPDENRYRVHSRSMERKAIPGNGL